MADKELLILAAKAAGIRGEWNKACSKFEKLSDEGWHAGFFDPLNSDYDALRLAVKLSLYIFIDSDKVSVDAPKVTTVEAFNGDPYAATRRAIVRAAAAIGEKL